MNSPKQALELVLGKSVSDVTMKTGGLTATQKEDLEKKSDPGFVAGKSRNPFSLQSKMRRAAEQSAFEGRLEIFKDQIQAVRKSNELLNRAAIAQVAVAAETFLTGLVADAERIKHSVKQDAIDGLTDRLEQKLIDLDGRRKRGVLPADMIEALQDRAINDFAISAGKITEVDVVFAKDKLLSIEFSSPKKEA
jgi:hypothetical protein